ncbi:P1 family peptidase [Fredinandcohnia quinoae]|uniref:P1 family peptidase n=1 Tax=Fredinandcohnia quinoae TaxID=2918902 RepID=A0AAW5ECX0_9BACI|nr:P1 family peptidase [Fredinandcohnia sp. SECRCQ15]MCH1627003.1 P1 family peptidase [Fredinandcohnia sp. SECRCQ15]
MQKRIRDYGIKIGKHPTGKLNKISDVAGVTVGHSTIKKAGIQTGVTAIFPHGENIFINKVIGATYAMNGFGKTVGTLQVEELGTIETPILLTNTLSIGECANSLISYMLEQNRGIGITTGTVNPLVGECNDMFLNDIRSQAIRKEHVYEALHTASAEFEEGSVGAGTGMRCFGLKGGIGSSSRVISYPHGTYTIGVLVLSNFGELDQFRMNGLHVGEVLKEKVPSQPSGADKGSIMIVIATDLPITSRQLKRIIKRASVGLSRTGSYIGNGSGDIFIGFSTANRINHVPTDTILSLRCIHEDDIDETFKVVADATEEAILNSLITATTTVGRMGNIVFSLNEYIHDLLLEGK